MHRKRWVSTLGFGSSAFGIVVVQFSDSIIQVLYANEFERPRYEEMLNEVSDLYHSYTNIKNIFVDASSPEVAYSYDILFTFAHVFHMRQRKVLKDNEWTCWLRWMKSAFEHGSIMEIWQSTIEMEKWFDPAFQEFVDKELIPRTAKNKS